MNKAELNILVVDDSPTVRRLSELILSQQGYRVYCAEDGEKGLELAQKIKPAAMLVDFVMPKMNGQQLCRALRSDPALKDIPVILISSKGETVGQAFEKQYGVVHYFTKPFEPDDLINKLHEVLESARAQVAEPAAGESATLGLDPGTFEEKVDKIIRRYFHRDFPILVKKVFSDTLYETGLVKKQTLILSGNLAKIPLPDLINFAFNSRLSGRLTVFSKTIFGEIFIEDGCFVFASLSRKTTAHQFLIDMMAVDGHIPANDPKVARLIEEAREQNIPVGRMLVDKGYLSNDQLMHYLKRHSQEAFTGILDARDGNFFLENETLPLNLQDINFRLPLMNVLMEGLRMQDEKQQAAVEFRNEDLVLMRLITNEDALEPYAFSEQELKVFALMDGQKSLREVISACDLDPLEIKRICYSLSKVGLLRAKTSGKP